MRSVRISLLVLLLGFLPVAPARATTLYPNDILVTGSSAVGQGLIRIDPQSGDQTLVSAGAYGDFQIVGRTVYAIGGGGVVAIDTQTGQSETFASGAFIEQPVGLAVGQDGNVYVLNGETASGGASIVQIDADSREQTILASDFGIRLGADLEIGLDGNLIVLAMRAEFGSAVFEVSVLSGGHDLLFDYRDIHDPNGGAPWGLYSTGLGVGPSGLIVASDGFSNSTGIAAYDPATGEAQQVGSTVVGVTSGGSVIELLQTDVAIDALGMRWIVGQGAGLGTIDGLFRDWRAEGGLPLATGEFNEIQVVGANPVPEPSPATLTLMGLALLAASGRSRLQCGQAAGN